MENPKIKNALTKCLEDKGKRKFTQSVEAIFNFRGIDFTKPEHRLNVDVLLPHGRGKETKVCVFAEGGAALDAEKAGASLVIKAADIEKLGQDKPKAKQMANDYVFLAEPKLMTVVAKHLGQIFGPRGKMPRPLLGKVSELVDQCKRRVELKSKGKYLPTAQCLIGSESMSVDQLGDNLEAVYERVRTKMGEQNISSVYVKLTMGKAVKVV